MLHFASYFLAQQLICYVHVFWLQECAVVRQSVQGDHPTPGRGQAIAYSHQLKRKMTKQGSI
jgi:hypothetical protein